jgi:hypothetical protein
MLVYRVERYIDSSGPYGICSINDSSRERHPLPDEDSILREKWMAIPRGTYHNYFFCFITKNQLMNWFGASEQNDIIRHNKGKPHDVWIGVSTYSCNDEDVLVGSSQCVFLMHKCQKIRFETFEEDLKPVTLSVQMPAHL